MGVGVLLLALSGIGLLRPVENVSYTVLSPIEAALRSIAQPIANAVSNYGDVRALTTENEGLRAENERLNAEIARLREEGTQHEQLERLLEVKNSLSDQDFSAAKVFARDPSNLREVIAIDRGNSDGMRVGMPVVTEGNTLVGTLTRVESDHAWVTLVTDVDSAVSSLILESRAPGVVAGGYNRRLSMEFVSQDSAVKEGDTVVTSGLGGSYPAGLVIGKVTGVSGQRQEVFRAVTVEPLASLTRLETVLVMTSFVPTRLTTP
ncbi:MAG: rod shape-determining protein MreC [Dehalococcoidia bacterium]|nr:rod shape-determining protein MreC [Dehalococcoidia bacterium]